MHSSLHALPVLQDNVIWIWVRGAEAVVIDPAVAPPVREAPPLLGERRGCVCADPGQARDLPARAAAPPRLREQSADAARRQAPAEPARGAPVSRR